MSNIPYEKWIKCAVCGSDHINVERNSENGKTESFDVKCHDCENEISVVP